MFRVSRSTEDGRVVVVRLEGRLTASGVPLVERICREAAASGCDVALDLAGLRYLGPAEAAAVVEILRRGAVLRGASGFVESLLGDARSRPR